MSGKRKNVWNAKAIRYAGDLTYEDFTIQRKDVTVIRFEKPLNEGAEPGWRYKNLVTRNIGSENVYLAWIFLEAGGGHDYHAHSGDEIIYILQNDVQFTYRSKGERDERSTLEEGDAAFIPAGTPHSVWNVKDKPVAFMVVKSPPYFLDEIPLDPALRQIRLFKR